MQKAVDQGMEILTTSTTCTFTMRNEYEHLLQVDNKPAKEHLTLATRFIYRLIENGDVKLAFRPEYKKNIVYHTPCHMERMGWTVYSTSLLRMIPGVNFQMLDSQCCGIGGTYGFKRENYPISQKIGENLFRQIEESKADYVATDCETCKWQIEMSTNAKVLNPISILAEALDINGTKKLNIK